MMLIDEQVRHQFLKHTHTLFLYVSVSVFDEDSEVLLNKLITHV